MGTRNILYGINTGLHAAQMGMNVTNFVQRQGDRKKNKDAAKEKAAQAQQTKAQKEELQRRSKACNDEIAFHKKTIKGLTQAKSSMTQQSNLAFRTAKLNFQKMVQQIKNDEVVAKQSGDRNKVFLLLLS